MVTKIIVLCGIWFIFGIYTGVKLWNHFFTIRIDIKSDDMTDEELEKIVKEIREKVEERLD